VRGRPAVGASASFDPAEEVALVARAKRDLLLRVHRYRLRHEDLEDCYGQATLELVAYVRRGGAFASRLHLGNMLEQRYLSRVGDRRRALSGRSPMQAALESSRPLSGSGDEGLEIADVRAELEELVMLRHDLRCVAQLAPALTPDQRLVLAGQLGQVGRADFCSRFGWSTEKYRKVAQRARSHLRALMAAQEYAASKPPARAVVRPRPTAPPSSKSPEVGPGGL
jgi:DNA-directed RNA polymerase specialized sigma24 family protein